MVVNLEWEEGFTQEQMDESVAALQKIMDSLHPGVSQPTREKIIVDSSVEYLRLKWTLPEVAE